MGEYTSESFGTLDCEYFVTIKIRNWGGDTEVYPQLLLIQKSMVDSSPELAHDDWVREQSEDTDIGLLVPIGKIW